MHNLNRPYVLSIAGFDASAGAGVLADIKTFEANNVYGFGVVSALTFQNDNEFKKVDWVNIDKIIEQIELLQKRFKIDFIKIGLIKSFSTLYVLISILRKHNPELKIVWDPVLKASSGFDFLQEIDKSVIENICQNIFLITPNIDEIKKLTNEYDEMKGAKELAKFCNVFLKGGHSEVKKGVDFLFTKDGKEFSFEPTEQIVFEKHGSGCVLSSAITANLANGLNLEKACVASKKYITKFLSSNDSLLGYHSEIANI